MGGGCFDPRNHSSVGYVIRRCLLLYVLRIYQVLSHRSTDHFFDNNPRVLRYVSISTVCSLGRPTENVISADPSWPVHTLRLILGTNGRCRNFYVNSQRGRHVHWEVTAQAICTLGTTPIVHDPIPVPSSPPHPPPFPEDLRTPSRDTSFGACVSSWVDAGMDVRG